METSKTRLEKFLLAQYVSRVKYLVQNDVDKIFPNFDTNHARIVLRTLIESAKYSILIFCDKISHEVYDDKRLLQALKEACDKGIDVRIIIQQENGDCEELFNMLLPDKIRCIKEQKDRHFCVIDNKRYRLEVDTINRKAYVNANDEKLAQALNDAFERLWHRAEQCSLPSISIDTSVKTMTVNFDNHNICNRCNS